MSQSANATAAQTEPATTKNIQTIIGQSATALYRARLDDDNFVLAKVDGRYVLFVPKPDNDRLAPRRITRDGAFGDGFYQFQVVDDQRIVSCDFYGFGLQSPKVEWRSGRTGHMTWTDVSDADYVLDGNGELRVF